MNVGQFFLQPLIFIAWILAIIFALSIHEFFHAWVAYRFGDLTAKNMGRLTLNPLAHLDFWGTLLLLFVGFGWGKPVPINPYNFKNQRYGIALVSLAGPLANFLLAIVGGFILKFLLIYTSLQADNLGITFLAMLIFLNLVLMIFNLIPVPPLDGSKILFSLLPASTINFQIFWERSGPMILLALIILDRMLPISILGSFLSGAVFKIGNLFVPGFSSLAF